MNLKKQYIFYFLFAVLSTLLNLGIQKGIEIIFTKIIITDLYALKLLFGDRLSVGLFLQMGFATITGFIFKYLADKIIIFKNKTKYISKDHFIQIFLYGIFAVLTTLVFWGTELCFKYFFMFNNSEYLGAVIGLITGYTLKFFLDRKYVFNN